MSDRFEEAVRQAARGLSTTEELPLYHDAWARGRRRRLIKRGALGVAGAALALAAIGVGAGGLGGPQSFETDDVATGLDVAAVSPTPTTEIPTTAIPTTEPTTIPSPVAGGTGGSGDEAAATDAAEATTVAPPEPTPTSAATPPVVAATAVPPTATAVPTPAPAPPPPPPASSSPVDVQPTATEVPAAVANEEPAAPEPTPTVGFEFEYSVPGPTATSVPRVAPQPTATSVATTTEPGPTATSVATTTAPEPTATTVPTTTADPQPPEPTEAPIVEGSVTTNDMPDDTGEGEVDEPPPVAADLQLPSPSPSPVSGRLDPTRLADAVVDTNVVPAPDASPCDSSYDGTFDALCEILEPYPCTDQVQATAGYTAIDTTGDGLLDTCEALNITSCDIDGDLLADVPCIISLVEPDQ